MHAVNVGLQIETLSNLKLHLTDRDMCESHRQDADHRTHTQAHIDCSANEFWAQLCTSKYGGPPWREGVGFRTSGQAEGPGPGRPVSPWASPLASFCSMEVRQAPAYRQIPKPLP